MSPLTQADLEALHEAGILTLVASHGDRREYRITSGLECLFPLPRREVPTQRGLPPYLYEVAPCE